MNTKAAFILMSLLTFPPMAAQAQAQKIFQCKDAHGKTISSDRPIAECMGRSVREMDRNGIVRREIPAPLTAEQRRQKELDEEKRKADEQAAAERKQADRALLARYRSESEIEAARKRAVETMHDQLKRERAALANAEQNRSDAQAATARAGASKNAANAAARRAEDAEQTVAELKKLIQGIEAEAAKIDERFAATLKRYRELTGTTANAQAPQGSGSAQSPQAAANTAAVTRTAAAAAAAASSGSAPSAAKTGASAVK